MDKQLYGDLVVIGYNFVVKTALVHGATVELTNVASNHHTNIIVQAYALFRFFVSGMKAALNMDKEHGGASFTWLCSPSLEQRPGAFC
tara:strand:- start:14759 stop:15022 length:264 start_codon:yes stop_codon:yes gene_type:complete